MHLPNAQFTYARDAAVLVALPEKSPSARAHGKTAHAPWGPTILVPRRARNATIAVVSARTRPRVRVPQVAAQLLHPAH